MPRGDMIVLRRDTLANWAAAEVSGPALAAGERGHITDLNVDVVGDGAKKVAQLTPVGSGTYAPKAADWATGASYVVGQLVVNAGTLYRCTTAHTAGGSFAAGNFAALSGGGATVTIDADGTLVVNGTTVDVGTDAEIAAAIALAVGTKADLASPSFSGIPTAPTAQQGDSSAQIATTAFVQSVGAAHPTLATRGGWVAMGDSITAGDYAYNATTKNLGETWPAFACALAGWRLPLIANVAQSGETSTQQIARFDAEVAPAKPAVVSLLVGTNDVNGGIVTLAQFQANIKLFVTKCLAIGALPVLFTIPPQNTGATKHTKVGLWNAWLQRFATLHSVPLVDMYGLLVNPLTGDYQPGYNVDTLHPAPTTKVLMAQRFNSVVLPLLPFSSAPQWGMDATDTSNLITGGGLFGGTVQGNGVAAGWSVFAFGTNTCTYSVVTDANVRGQVQRIDVAAGTVYQGINFGIGGGTPAQNEIVAVSGFVKTDGSLQAKALWTASGSPAATTSGSYQLTPNLGGWTPFYFEFPHTGQFATVYLGAQPGTGRVEFANICARNLTANSLLQL